MDIEANHIPPWDSWKMSGLGGLINDPSKPVWMAAAPSMTMEQADRLRLDNRGSGRGPRRYRNRQATFIQRGEWEGAMMMDVNHIRDVFGDKYVEALLEAMEYAETFMDD